VRRSRSPAIQSDHPRSLCVAIMATWLRRGLVHRMTSRRLKGIPMCDRYPRVQFAPSPAATAIPDPSRSALVGWSASARASGVDTPGTVLVLDHVDLHVARAHKPIIGVGRCDKVPAGCRNRGARHSDGFGRSQRARRSARTRCVGQLETVLNTAGRSKSERLRATCGERPDGADNRQTTCCPSRATS
jgi:hypothetical protein